VIDNKILALWVFLWRLLIFVVILLAKAKPIRNLCINRNNHHKPTFHPLGDFLNPALALPGQGLKKSPIGQKLDFANHPYILIASFMGVLLYTQSCVG
jgi:hypothetical protein